MRVGEEAHEARVETGCIPLGQTAPDAMWADLNPTGSPPLPGLPVELYSNPLSLQRSAILYISETFQVRSSVVSKDGALSSKASTRYHAAGRHRTVTLQAPGDSVFVGEVIQ